MFVETENKQKRDRGWPIFLKKTFKYIFPTEVVLFDAAGVFGGIIHNDKKPGDGFSIKDPNHEFYYKRQTLEIQVKNCLRLDSFAKVLKFRQIWSHGS